MITQDQKKATVGSMVITILVILNVIIVKIAFVGSEKWYGLLFITIPILLLALSYKCLKRLANTWKKIVRSLPKLDVLTIPGVSSYTTRPHLSSQVLKSDGQIHQNLN